MKKTLVSGSVAGALALVLAAGGLTTAARAETAVTHQGPAAAAPAGAPTSFADIVQRVAPAVVSIDVEGKADPSHIVFGGGGGDDGDDGDDDGDSQSGPGGPSQGLPFGFSIPRDVQPHKMEATGSGFFISPDGYIVTNNHVVEGADKITVRTSDGRSLKATLVGRDPDTDLAVVKVEGKDFPFVDFEDRAKPRVGDWVVAVGNPFNLGGTATAGIVSALGRANVSGSNYVDYMQIDAPINRGNSGGPTFDMNGRVVGVNTAIFSPTGGSVGIGFDIPADVAAQISRQLISGGKVVRGYIGATVQDVTPEISDSLGLNGRKGALIADLTPNGPSEAAGLKPGDVVMAMDGHEVTSASDLTRQVATARAGDVIHLQIRRDGKVQDIDVKSGTRPSDAILAKNEYEGPGPNGAAQDIPRILGMRLTPRTEGGLTVKSVSADSDAGEKGVREGDVILSANDRKVGSTADLALAVAEAHKAGRENVLLMITHAGRNVFVPIKIAPDKATGKDADKADG